MGLVKGTIIGILIGISVSACTSIPFLYKFYIYNYENQILQGPEPKDDLESKICSSFNNQYQCVVMRLDEFYRLKSDYQKKTIRLIELEKKCGRNN